MGQAAGNELLWRTLTAFLFVSKNTAQAEIKEERQNKYLYH
jgi:hypothetical protein